MMLCISAKALLLPSCGVCLFVTFVYGQRHRSSTAGAQGFTDGARPPAAPPWRSHCKHAEKAASLHNTCLDKIVCYLQRICNKNRKLKQQASK